MTRMLLNRSKEEMLRQEAQMVRPIVRRKIVPVGVKVISVLKTVIRKKNVRFDEFFDHCTSRSELVATFMAVLELLKVSRINVSEPDENDDVYISLNENYVKPTETPEETDGN